MKEEKPGMDRRRFLAKAGAVVAGSAVFKSGWAGSPGQSGQTAPAALVSPSGPPIKLGLIGCGGRGSWIAGLFKRHGGYEIVAGADYFPDRLAEFGPKFGVPVSRLFSGLSGYKRLLASGVDAVAIESPPYFHPEQAAAAVEAGVHVYLAKPSAVDSPGCRSIAASGRQATAKKRAFLIDFQTRTNPFFREALARVHRGELGEIVFAEAIYHADCPFEDHYPLLTARPNDAEAKLRAWGLDRALSGDMITEQDIHALDVASWVMGAPPVSAVGTGGLKARPKIGSCWDHFVVQYAYPGGVAVQFSGRQFKGHGTAEGIKNRVFGSKGVLETTYGGNVLIRGENFYRGGDTSAIYEEGAVANIAEFARSIHAGDWRNPTVEPSVMSNLVTVLGRKAAVTGRPVTWAEIEKDEERLIPDLKGLKD
ncbi:MAG: Gfo/Idh/MocA family oxidoreductase [Candidatus Aminicenantes bacterium]|nr:Gfo/Idh/MocA family oxidoreductase [Candidatus Aminicenantes bacterium]